MPRFDIFTPRPADYDPEADGHAILAGAIESHDPSSVWALFSGGHDSLCATHVAARHPRFSGVVHIKTGTGIKETTRFVYETCRRHGWPLRIYRPRAADRYEAFVLEHGFPGPAQHGRMYQRLKERSLDRHVAAMKTRWNDRIVLVTGCREAESRRRMGTAEPVQRDGASVWVAPCVSWVDDAQERYMARHALPRNPVKDHLCMSGECLCGAFAKSPAELDEIDLWYPRAADNLRRLERRAAAAGVPCRWGVRPPRPVDGGALGQQDAFDLSRAGGRGIATMCYSCELRQEPAADPTKETANAT